MACLRCGTLATIPLACTVELKALLNGMTSLLSSLSTCGIIHDLHLRILMGWAETDRTAFINSLGPDKITSLDKMLLKKKFSGGTSDMGGPILWDRLEFIPRPPADVENCLMSPDCPISALQEAMQLDRNDKNFRDIVVGFNYRVAHSLLIYTSLI